MIYFKPTLCAVALTLVLASSAVAGNIGGARTNAFGNIGGARVGNIAGTRTGNIGGTRTGNIAGTRGNSGIAPLNTGLSLDDPTSSSVLSMIHLILQFGFLF
jgi:hypothetical protein